MNFEEIAANLPEKAVCKINDLPWPRVSSGKVREIFDLGDRLLLVASDRISAFDVILPQGIPGKGIILTQLSLFWFEQFKNLVADHLVPDQESVLRDELKLSTDLQLRSMVVRKLAPLPIECVVRGYLAGSGPQPLKPIPATTSPSTRSPAAKWSGKPYSVPSKS
jgi:phosphoribosylaminoimidazole-succinocarboxamide synthase